MLSLIIPVYNESKTIPEMISRLEAVKSSFGMNLETIFVDDGSTDNTAEILKEYISKYSWINILILSRNFGHQYAVSAGFDQVSGDIVGILDGDLQDPPELFKEMFIKMQEGFDVVYGIRKKRKENIIKRSLYYFFYRILYMITDIWIPADAGDFCLLSDKVVKEIKKIPERNRFIRGIRAWVGFKQIGFPYERHERFASNSKYSFTKLIHLALDGIFGFSLKPLRMIFIVGMVIAFLAIVIGLFYFIRRVFFGLTPPGFTTLVILNLFFGGMQFAFVGIIAEYIARIYQEVRQRPLYIIKELIKGKSSATFND
jgi:glycosyltransferase involved in cell wall biosynthesis